jgi:hypothetical protein
MNIPWKSMRFKIWRATWSKKSALIN